MDAKRRLRSHRTELVLGRTALARFRLVAGTLALAACGSLAGFTGEPAGANTPGTVAEPRSQETVVRPSATDARSPSENRSRTADARSSQPAEEGNPGVAGRWRAQRVSRDALIRENLRLARKAFEANDHTGCLMHVRCVLRLDPAHREALELRGQVHRLHRYPPRVVYEEFLSGRTEARSGGGISIVGESPLPALQAPAPAVAEDLESVRVPADPAMDGPDDSPAATAQGVGGEQSAERPSSHLKPQVDRRTEGRP